MRAKANRQQAITEPTLLLTHADLRRYGVSSADLRRGVPPGILAWPLRGEIRQKLTPLLTEARFDERAPISVRVSRNPWGFELTGLPAVRREAEQRTRRTG